MWHWQCRGVTDRPPAVALLHASFATWQYHVAVPRVGLKQVLATTSTISYHTQAGSLRTPLAITFLSTQETL